MNESLFLVITMVPAVLLAVALYWVDVVRRRECLFRWASNNNLRLVHFRHPFVVETSPFPFSVSRSQHVFRVEVETESGNRKSGWVRIGSPWLGLLSKRADVNWDL